MNGSSLSKLISTKTSWLTRTRYFQKAIDASFDTVDADQSGCVTFDELYSGLLLIHLKFAVYVGASACRVRERRPFAPSLPSYRSYRALNGLANRVS